MNTYLLELLLRRYEILLNTPPLKPHNVVSLCEYIVHLELKQEHQALRDMLDDSDTFETAFKARCLWRMTNPDSARSFTVLPDSIVNRLYLEITHLVFKPKTMPQLLAIILPGISAQLIPVLAIPQANLTRDQLRNPEFTLSPCKNFSGLCTDPPNGDLLSHYVVSGSNLFDLRSIALFSLPLHNTFKQLLTETRPDLAQCLYRHNESMLELSDDLLRYSHQATLPRKALNELVRGLTLGGSRFTGTKYAGPLAEDACKRFFDYFNHLPEQTQHTVRALKNNILTLGDIFDRELGRGHCVETAAAHLTSVLQANPKCVLDEQALMTPAELKKLLQKYQMTTSERMLDTKKSLVLQRDLPLNLAKEAVRLVSVESEEDLIMLFISFPETCYALLWNHVTCDDETKFRALNQVLKGNLFSMEQRDALVRAVIPYLADEDMSHCDRLRWALRTKNAVLIAHAFAFIPVVELIEVCDTLLEGGWYLELITYMPINFYPLYWSSTIPHILDRKLDDLTNALDKNRLSDTQCQLLAPHVVAYLKASDDTLKLRWALKLNHPLFFNALFASIDEEAKATAISDVASGFIGRLRPVFGFLPTKFYKFFWEGLTHPRLETLNKLHILLHENTLSAEQRDALIKAVLPTIKQYSYDFLHIEGLFNMNELVFIEEAFKHIRQDRMQYWINRLLEDSDFYGALIQVLPIHRYEQFWLSGLASGLQEYNTLFLDKFDALCTVLEKKSLNLERRQALAKVCASIAKRSPGLFDYYLYKLFKASDPLFVHEAFTLIPENQRLAVLKKEVGFLPPLAHHAAKYPDLFAKIMALIPEHDYVAVFNIKHKGNGLLQGDMPFDKLKSLLDSIPKNQRVVVVNSYRVSMGGMQSSLISDCNSIQACSYFLSFYPRQQRLQRLYEKDAVDLYWRKTTMDLDNFKLVALLPEYHRIVLLRRSLRINFAALAQEEHLKDSFVRELSLLSNLQEYLPEEFKPGRLIYKNSFDEIKSVLLEYFIQNPNSPVLTALTPSCIAELPLEWLKQKWFKGSIRTYLEEQIDYLPKASRLRAQLKDIQLDIELNCNSIKQLQNAVAEIKTVVSVHQDTGALGFFKCTWARETAGYSKLVKLLEIHPELQDVTGGPEQSPINVLYPILPQAH